MSNSNYDLEWRFENNLMPYSEAIKIMESRVQNISENKDSQLIWVLEHLAVYTAGISAKDQDLLFKNDIEIIKTNRGGKYTYHGPGMKIIYAMIDLKKLFYPANPDITKFVEFLEFWIIAVLKNYKIEAGIRKGRVGLWVNTSEGEKKICAIGIKIKKWISYHGVALNINPNLNNFQNIVPCGIKEYGVTSLAEMGVCDFNQEEFYKILKIEFQKCYKQFFKNSNL
ncbi:MAG: lipoyl(octanoyl) transferase LipB [Proteobacteria bacterium]|nr:lipoyl(octanoyl) transferase LipB [Pseudomonadota bacterium]